jgi:hypothetical protein
MRRWPLTTLVALLWVGAICAATPDMDGVPLALTSSSAVVVSVTGGAPGKVQWGVSPKPAGQSVLDGSLIVWGPGTYSVSAAVLSSGDVGLLQLDVTVPPSGGPAPVVPGPVPGPDTGPVVPPPATLTTPTWALAVFDTSQQISLPAGQLEIFKSQTITASLAGIGVTWRHYDKADPAVTGSDWGRAALKLAKPALVLYRDKQVVAGWPVNLPASEQDVFTLVRSAVGR